MLTELKEPEGGEFQVDVPKNGQTRGQHTTDPSVRTPQVCSRPAETLTEMKVPDGGEASSVLPQHTIDPSVRTPQAR